MCTGFEIAMMAAAALTAVGTVSAGIQQGKQMDAQGDILRQQADHAKQVGAANEDDYRRQQSRLMAARRALLGGSGTDGGEGSNLYASEDMAGEIELQALRIRNGSDVTATRLNQQAGMVRAQGRAAKQGSFFRAGASLLQGAGYAYGGGGKTLDPKYPGGFSDRGFNTTGVY
jgi:hypothetical protein